MSGSKRKRDEDIDQGDWYDDNGGFFDDDSEPHRFGTAVLPVANLPSSFEGIPQDGMEYLFTVRREERRLPLVTRVLNPYAIPENKQRGSSVDGNAANDLSTNLIPPEEWRTCFEERFRNLRANLRQPTIHISLPSRSGTYETPEMRDRDRWWAFFRGDVEWESVPSSQFHGTKKWKQGRQKKGTVNYEEVFPREAKMRAWVVYGENLGWDQDNEGEVVELSYGGGYVNATTVESEDADQDEVEEVNNADSPPWESHNNEKPEDVPAPPHLDCLSPAAAVSDNLAVSTDGIVPREPTPHLLSILDQKTAFHLLRYFSQWIQAHFEPSSLPPPPHLPTSQLDSPNYETRSYDFTPCHGRWIFSLLSRLDAQLTGDEISVLRKLARECVRLIKEERSSQSTRMQKSTTAQYAGVGENACWMIVAAVAGIWGQKDLWAEAADMLRMSVD